ncbi:MAG: hypothetical protein ACC619_09965, partial [Paracoccaceae bacterium]
MTIFRAIVLSIVLVMSGALAQAQNSLALIIANQDYKILRDARDAFRATEVEADLQAAGFEVRVIRDLDSATLARMAPGLRRDIQAAERVLIFVSGHIVSNGRESWLLTTDARRDDVMLTGAYGLPIGDLLDLLGQKPGAGLLLAARSDATPRLVEGLSYGLQSGVIPQGVAVFSGAPGDLVKLLRGGLLDPGSSIGAAAGSAPRGVTAAGFLPPSLPFVP